ncbi:MAG: lysophospholipid acyltransferase family protein, partial [Planctomycetota bacterium]
MSIEIPAEPRTAADPPPAPTRPVVSDAAPSARTDRDDPTPTVWPWLAWGFQKYCAWYVPRHFHAVRLQVDDSTGDPFATPGPVVCYMNHAGWWDLVVGFGIAPAFWTGRTAYSPIDAAALEAYPLFNKLGLFPVERSAAGLRKFLRTSRAILANDDAAYWITPQGRFADPRERPLEFDPGLGHLAKSSPGLTLVPIAVEYVFWNETLPEALIRVG